MQVLFGIYFLILPILFFRGFFDPFEFPRLLLTYGFLLLALPVFFFQRLGRPQTLRITLPDLLVLVFLLLVGLSTFFAEDKLQAFWGNYPRASQSLLFYLALGILYFLVRATFDTFEKIKELLVFVLIGLGAASIYGLFLYVQGILATNDFGVRVSGTESHPILFGALMMLGLFVLFSLKRGGPFDSAQGQRLARLAVLIFLTGIIISGSRGIWIATVVGLAIAIGQDRSNSLTRNIVASLNKSRANKLRVTIFIFALLLVTMLGFRLPSLFDISPSSSTNIRSLELKDALRLAKDKVFPFGIGPSHLPFYYPQYRSPQHNLTNEWSQYPQQVRNNYLDILIAFGPFTLIVFSLIILQIFINFVIRNTLNVKRFAFHAFLFAGWIALLVHGLFYFYTTSSWIYFWTLTALLVNQASMKAVFSIQLKRVVTIFLKTNLFIPLLAGSLALFFVGGRVLIQTLSSELTFTKGLTAYQQISYLAIFSEEADTNILFTRYSFNENDRIILQKAVEYFNQALKTVPYPNSLYTRQYIHSLALLGRMQANQEDQKKYYIQAYGQVTQDIKNNPYDLLNFRLRSSVSFRMALDNVEREKYLSETIKDDERLIQLDPTNPLNFDNFGLVLRESGKLDEAKKAFQKSIDLKPDRLPTYLHLGETLALLGKKEEALAVYKKAQGIGENKQNQLIIEKIKELEEN